MKFDKFFKIIVIIASVMFIINLLFPGFWTIKETNKQIYNEEIVKIDTLSTDPYEGNCEDPIPNHCECEE